MKSNNDKLMPCPFCGSTCTVMRVNKKFVQCSNDDCALSATVFLPIEWNTRASTLKAAEPEGELVAFIDDRMEMYKCHVRDGFESNPGGVIYNLNKIKEMVSALPTTLKATEKEEYGCWKVNEDGLECAIDMLQNLDADSISDNPAATVRKIIEKYLEYVPQNHEKAGDAANINLPWHYYKQFVGGFAIDNADNETVCEEMDEVNAQFIVRATKSHYALISLAKRRLEDIEYKYAINGNKDFEFEAMIARTKATIAEAEDK